MRDRRSMTRYGVLLREAARQSAGPAGALLCVLMALGWLVGQAWAATADGGGRLPSVADGGGRLPPVADGGARLPPAAGSGGRAWPVAGPGGRVRPVVERGFEPPPEPWAAGHRGVDLGAAPGTEVVAAATGRVSFAGTVAG